MFYLGYWQSSAICTYVSIFYMNNAFIGCWLLMDITDNKNSLKEIDDESNGEHQQNG